MEGKEKEMSHMKPDIQFGVFDIIETKNGTHIIPIGTLDESEIIKLIDNTNVGDLLTALNKGLYNQLEGWFARFSAPGYMDCTDWSGPYDSELHAMRELDEQYGPVEDEDLEGTDFTICGNTNCGHIVRHEDFYKNKKKCIECDKNTYEVMVQRVIISKTKILAKSEEEIKKLDLTNGKYFFEHVETTDYEVLTINEVKDDLCN